MSHYSEQHEEWLENRKSAFPKPSRMVHREYRVIHGKDNAELEWEVNNLLLKGWYLFGPAQISSDENNFDLIQTLVKYE